MNKLLLLLIVLTLLSCKDNETVQSEQLPSIIINTKKELAESVTSETSYDIDRKKGEIKCKTLHGDFKLELLYSKKEYLDEEQFFGYKQLWLMNKEPSQLSLPIGIEGIHFIPNTKDSDCEGSAGYLIEDKYIMIPAHYKSPPHEDIFAVFVFDYKTKNLIAKKSFKHSLYNNSMTVPPLTKKNIDGLSYQSWIGRSDDVNYKVKNRGEAVIASECVCVYLYCYYNKS